MVAVKSKNTKPEELVRKYLFAQGFRYRKNVNKLLGCPDIVLPKYNTVVFVNGCFWHKHDCKYFRWPKSNIDYWNNKIMKNVNRDASNKELLTENGWHVLTVWECELKHNYEERMEQLVQEIKG